MQLYQDQSPAAVTRIVYASIHVTLITLQYGIIYQACCACITISYTIVKHTSEPVYRSHRNFADRFQSVYRLSRRAV
jgi:hypothetical protein